MRIDEFITRLRKNHNIIVEVNGNELKIQAQQKDLTREIIAELKAKKTDIIAFFESAGGGGVFQSIARASKKDYYKLSSAQKRQYFLYEFDEQSTAYNLPQVVRLKGQLDKEKLNYAFNALMQRHEVLRTSFEIVNKEPFQKINEVKDIDIEHFEVGEEQVASTIKDFIRPFNLSQSPLIRVGLMTLTEEEHILMVDVHHIITDGVSQEVLLKDFLTLYHGQQLEALDVQYRDYAEWQQSSDGASNKSKEYWLKQYAELPEQLELPLDFKRPAVKQFSGKAMQFELTKSQSAKLRQIADTNEATLFMTVFSLFNIFISKIGNTEDVIIGTPTAGRQHAETQQMIGMFLNSITLRNQPKSNLSFTEFLTSVKSKTLDGFDHQDYQYEELINDLKIERDVSRNPLYDVRFVFQNYEKEEFKIAGLDISTYEMQREVAQFDLTLYVEAGEQIKFSFNYSDELFTEDLVKRFVNYFQSIAEAVIADPTVKLGDIDLLTKEERNELLHDFNNTAVDYQQQSVIGMFKERLSNNPEGVAVVCTQHELTYAELDNISNGLAQEIKAINQSDIVAIYMEPSLEMIVAILAVLKSGAAYLPIDPKQRSSRHQVIIGESNCKMLLTQQDIKDELSFAYDIIVVDTSSYTGMYESIDFSEVDGMAYVIYTSGSTGQPKGAKIKHSNVVNYANWFKNFLPINEQDKSLLTSSFAFDLGYSSIFPALLAGSELHLIKANIYQSPDQLLTYINDNEITYLKVTPSLYSTFMLSNHFSTNLTSVRYILTGGEQVKTEPMEQTIKHYPELTFINHYGPTETTIGVVAGKINDIDSFKSRPVIGRPIDNTRLYILNEKGALVPKGVVGELCIAGDNVGAGYLNMPEATDEKFVSGSGYADIIYKTGDRARWAEQGDVEFLGRIDSQVKIRGYRVELGEIEDILTAHPFVTEATVIAKENDEQEKFLAAYVVAQQGVDIDVLKGHLGDQLPDYMVPSQWMQMELLPLTPNGKLDKRALPEPEIKSDAEVKEPSSEMENKLIEIWADLFKREQDKIGVEDDFFGMGGNSIMAIKLNYNIQLQFLVQLHMRQVFENPTIQKLAKLIESSQTEKTEEITPIAKSHEYIASSAQRRLYYEHQSDINGLNYNITNVYRLVGDVDIDKLESVFQKLTDRHESLRTGFGLSKEGEVSQIIHGNLKFELVRLNAQSYNTLKDAVDDFVRPFDLSHPGLMRGGVFEHPQLGNFLFMDMHHIICDGISKNILMNDFRKLYTGEQLPTLDLRYIDYAAWQRNPKGSVAKQKDYWMNKLSGDIQPIQLPRMQEKEEVIDISSEDQGMKLDGELFDQIKAFTTDNNVSDFMFLLSIYYILLSKVSGNNDLIVGTDVAGRTHPKLDYVVGTFVNFLPLRVQLDDSMTYQEFLNQIKECVLEAFENQDYQYDQMVSELKERGVEGNIFDVHFALANYLDQGVQLDDLKFELVRLKWAETSKFEFKVHAVDENDKFLVHFVYNTSLYDQGTMSLLMTYYRNILLNVLADKSTPVAELQMVNIMDIAQ